MADAFSVRADFSAALAALDQIETRAKAAARPAAQAGAQLLYEEAKARAPVAAAAHVLKSGRVIPPGALKASIYQVYSKSNSSEADGRATYHVSYNAKKAPHGALVEFGHVQTRVAYLGKDGRWYTSKAPLAAPRHVAARPYLRPAYDAVHQRALEVAKARFVAEMSTAPGVTTA